MKRPAAAPALLPGIPCTASAEDVMKTACKDFMSADENEQTIMIAWIDGHLGHRIGDTALTEESIEKPAKSLVESCKDNGCGALGQALKQRGGVPDRERRASPRE